MTGSDACSDATVSGELRDSDFSSAGSARATSVRSLFGPGREIARLRFVTGPWASLSSGASARRKVASVFVFGLETSTRRVSASSVGMRLASVVLPWSQRRGQLAQSGGERHVLGADRAERRVGVLHQ